MSSAAENIDAFTRSAEVQVKMIQALGEYRKDMAQALSQEIAAEGDSVVIDMNNKIIHSLENDLSSLLRERARITSQAEYIEKMQRWLAFLDRGENLSFPLVPNFYIAYGWFFQRLSGKGKHDIFGLRVEEQHRQARCFSRNSGQSGEENAPEEIANVPALVAWMESKIYMPRIGSHVHLLLTDAIDIMRSAAESDIKNLNAKMDELRTGTYKDWSPKDLLSVPTNTGLKF